VPVRLLHARGFLLRIRHPFRLFLFYTTLVLAVSPPYGVPLLCFPFFMLLLLSFGILPNLGPVLGFTFSFLCGSGLFLYISFGFALFFASVVIMKHYTPNDLLYFPLSLFSDPVDSCVNRPSAVRIWPICVVLCGSLPLCFAFCFYGLAIVICHPHLQSRLRFGFHCTSNDLFAPFSVSLFSDLVDLYVNWPLHLCIGPICLNTHVYIRFGNVFLSSCNNISLLRIWFFIRCPLCISGTG
jgi:hypothetical protein